MPALFHGAVRAQYRAKTMFHWSEKGGIPIIYLQSRVVGGEVCEATIKEEEGEEGEEEEKWEISANPVVSFSSAPAGQHLSGGGVRQTGDLCRSNTQDPPFRQHPPITRFSSFLPQTMLSIFFWICVICVTGLAIRVQTGGEPLGACAGKQRRRKKKKRKRRMKITGGNPTPMK